MEIVAGATHKRMSSKIEITQISKYVNFRILSKTYRDLLSVNCRLNSNHKHRFPRFNLFFYSFSVTDGSAKSNPLGGESRI